MIYERAWNLLTQDKFEELRFLASKPFSNELLKMNDIKNNLQLFTGAFVNRFIRNSLF